MRFLRDVFLQPLHQQLDFEQREILAAGEMDEHGLGILEQRALVEQRAVQRVFQGLGSAVLARGDAGTEEAAGAVRPQRAHQIVEPDVDEPRPDDEPDDGLDRLADHMVRGGESLVDALFGEDQLAHPVVVEGDERVGEHGKFVERGFRLLAAAFTLEGKGHRGENHDERALFAGDPGDDGSRARAGAAAKAGAQKHNAAALD